MTTAKIARVCLDLAAYIERSGAASSRALRRTAACLRYMPRSHLSRHHADVLSERILAGTVRADELRAFVDLLTAVEAA